MKTTILPLRNSMNRSARPLALLFIPLALVCFALPPQARAVCQQGCDTNNNNTFLGDDALTSNTTGVYNTAVGSAALLLNTAGYQNTATGASALTSNDGFANTANGYSALQQNTSGFHNTANGAFALQFNTTGSNNTANGVTALLSNTSGFDNTADGAGALFSNTTGINNTAVGPGALDYNTTGSRNIAIGYDAGSNLTTGGYNIYIGTPGGDARESNKIRIGTSRLQTKTFISGISGVTVPAGVGVIIGTNGQLGTVVSSERFKEAIKPMDKASEAILALHPVTFRYRHELDPDGIPQFGLVAEDVQKINPALVARDDQGKPYTVRYEVVNAMLLNEFLKEHREVQEQKATIAEFKKEIANLTATVKQQSAQIQRVSAQLEVSKPAPQVTQNDL